MTSPSRWSQRSWWFVAGLSVVIASLAGFAAQQVPIPQATPSLSLRADAPKPLIPVMFLKFPDGRLAAQTPEMGIEFDSGGRLLFQGRGQAAFQLRFDGARPEAQPEGLEPLPTRINILGGNIPAAWQPSLPAFGAVRYRGLYPGIDMVYRAANRIKSEFVVAPGADPARIRMRFSGGQSLSVDDEGSLRVKSAEGELRDEHLQVFQWIAGRKVKVPARFNIVENQVAGFELGSFDPGSELVIDPVISYSSYLGGSRIDQITAVAVDAAGAAYVSGWTDSQNFPVLSSIRIFSGSVEAFVAKIGPTGALEWATFIGGSSDDRALGIAVDPSGNSYAVGYTTSTNFPTVNPLQANKSGGRDVFVTKLNSTGSAIVYSTYWGGSGNEQANGVAVDVYGQPYVVGDTDSANFPTKFPWRSALGGLRDAFHFKIGVNGAMSYSTYVGGSGDDRGITVAITNTLTPYIAGCTASNNFPTSNALQSANAGGQDAFVIRFNSDADNVIFSTYLGGNGGAVGQPECANSIAVDEYNNVYVAGVTSSTNFPHQVAVQNTLNGLIDGFITKFDVGGVILFSTYIGGSGSDVATGVRIDAARRAYVVGYTTSKNLPVSNPIQSSLAGNFDGFLLRYDVSGYPFTFGTYLGGQGSDTPTSLGLLPGGAAFVVGATASGNYPTQSPFQPNFGGSTDGFITKITGF